MRARRGLDLVLEGDAVQVSDEARLQRIAGAYEVKYGSVWHYDVRDGAFITQRAGRSCSRSPRPGVLGFRKGEYSQTRWRF